MNPHDSVPGLQQDSAKSTKNKDDNLDKASPGDLAPVNPPEISKRSQNKTQEGSDAGSASVTPGNEHSESEKNSTGAAQTSSHSSKQKNLVPEADPSFLLKKLAEKAEK